ncbi:hypothetical protein CsSME_00022377 [Camellia sinensis var. sinensis]
MRTSCNGCRVLRKGCTDDCSLRPCLQWINSPDSQSNATLFLAKFYGRAGLLNLLNAGPNHLRPSIFRSLLYEACGRIINPISGSVGLLCSNNWDRCQEAVDAVLNGSPIMKLNFDDADAAAAQPIMPLKGCDIRHLTKDSDDNIRHRKTPFKRSGGRGKSRLDESTTEPARFCVAKWGGNHPEEEVNRHPSHDSSMFSVETLEASLLVNRAVKCEPQEIEVGLDLSLGFNPVFHPQVPTTVEERKVIQFFDGGGDV